MPLAAAHATRPAPSLIAHRRPPAKKRRSRRCPTSDTRRTCLHVGPAWRRAPNSRPRTRASGPYGCPAPADTRRVGADGRLSRARRTTPQVAVRRGAPLVRIDARSLALSQSEASAQVRALEVESSLAAKDCERAGRLYHDNSISKAEYDRLSARCESTDWSKAAALARSRLASKA